MGRELNPVFEKGWGHKNIVQVQIALLVATEQLVNYHYGSSANYKLMAKFKLSALNYHN